MAHALPDDLLRNHLERLDLQRWMLVLKAGSGCEAHPVRHRHRLHREGIALRLLLYLEIVPVVSLACGRHQLRLTEELHVGGAGIAGRGGAVLVLRSKLQLIHHQSGAVLLLLPVVNQVLLVLQVNSREV